MKLIIDIPDKDYCTYINEESYLPLDILCAIRSGTPLPKGHGDLKDFEKIYAYMTEKEELARQRVIDTPTNSPCYMRYMAQLNERTAFKKMLFDAPTIIEADKAESEEV